VIPDTVAVILAVPAATPVAKPDEEMVAIVLSELAQVTGDVMSDIMPFERVPTALNNWEDPTTKLSGDAGVIARPVNVVTGNITLGLVIPDRVAVILEFPGAMPIAKPDEDMVTILVSELAQVTFPVMSAVESSEYVPEAANCSVRPTAKLLGVLGVTAMDDNVEATTSKLTAGLVIPDRVAVILVFPTAMPVAKPAESIVAVDRVSLAHVT